MLQEIRLPFGGSVRVCDICGNADARTVRKCEKAGMPQLPPLQIGQTVRLYRRVWERAGPVRSATAIPFVVVGFVYASPLTTGYQLAFALAANSAKAAEEQEPPVHQLGVKLKSMDGLGSTTMPCEELLLWQEGDIAKLHAALLIPVLHGCVCVALGHFSIAVGPAGENLRVVRTVHRLERENVPFAGLDLEKLVLEFVPVPAFYV